MKLNAAWEEILDPYLNTKRFGEELEGFLNGFPLLIPKKEQIFAVFDKVQPQNVRCVLFGEDPYPRVESACGIAFWDKEIKTWYDKTNGNSLKNILKAVLTAQKQANYKTSIAQCRQIVAHNGFLTPPELFELWLKQGVLLVNAALTFSNSKQKKLHFTFWQSFHKALIKALNNRPHSPYYILWGRKAQAWEADIVATIDNHSKIIKQGHPTFIHQFMDKERPDDSPFTEIAEKTGIKWW